MGKMIGGPGVLRERQAYKALVRPTTPSRSTLIMINERGAW